MSEQKVASVERALEILNAFSDGKRKLSLAELSERTGFYRSTILRIADSLRRYGYLHRDTAGFFSLGPTLWRLGVLYHNAFDLADHVRPVLADLVVTTGETATFYIRQGDKRLCLYRHHSSSPIRHHVDEGTELDLDRSADAHVLTAFTGGGNAFHEGVKAKGYCVSLGERNPEAGGVSAPVFGAGGTFIGALGVTGLKDHFTGENGERIISTLLKKSRDLSQTLAGQ
jgi:DNA-binding IclR family transcriptional regulator